MGLPSNLQSRVTSARSTILPTPLILILILILIPPPTPVRISTLPIPPPAALTIPLPLRAPVLILPTTPLQRPAWTSVSQGLPLSCQPTLLGMSLWARLGAGRISREISEPGATERQTI